MGTYLEEFLEKTSSLPGEVRRNFELMRSLDVVATKINLELTQHREDYLTRLRDQVRRGVTTNSEESNKALLMIKEKHKKAVQKADEKVAIAVQTYDLIDKNIKDLNSKLKAFETDLRASGKYNDKLTNATTSAADKRKADDVGGRARGPGRKRARPALPNIPVQATAPPADETPIDPNEPTYCICQRVSFGEMVGCDNDDCEIEWFHFECVGLSEQPKGKWYCPPCNARMQTKKKKRGAGGRGGYRQKAAQPVR